MKKILLLVGFALALLPNVHSQNYFINEDFNNGIPATWTNTAVSGSHDWMHGIMSDETDNVPNASLDGTPMVYFNDDSLGYIDNGATNLDNTVELLSPVVNTVANYPLYLEFDYNFRRYNAANYFKVEIHDGTSWTTLLNVSNNDCGKWGGVCTPPHFFQDISSYAGNNLQLRFSYHDGNDWAYWAAFDNVQLYSPFDYDVMPIAINTPFTNCGLTTSEAVSVTIQNRGLQTVSNFPISFQIDNNPPVTETVTQSIQRDSTYLFTFSTPADLSIIKNYNVKVYTNLNNDQAPGNDMMQDSVGNVASISPDYTENFDNGAPGWKIYGTNPSFEIGVPTGIFINGAVSSPNVLVTNLDGHYNSDELSYVETPCFNFTATQGAPFMRFDLKFQSQANDELWMEESFDGGATWAKVVPFTNSKNWYNNKQSNVWNGNSGSWIKVENALSNINGQDNVKYRFVFKSNAVNVLEGFAIDNFSIVNPDKYDVKISELISPDNSATCGFNKNQELILRLFNQGQQPIPTASLKYRINSGPGASTTIYNETKAINLLPDDPYLWVHTIPIDLEESGTYVMDIWIEIPNDTIHHNDSIIGYTINHNAILSSYLNFENPQWTVGSPATGQNWTTQTKTAYQWKVESLNSSPSNTGPAADHTTNFPIGNGKYIYTFVQPDPNGTPFGDTTTFTSPCINFGVGNGGVINYWYHKLGGNMGNLFVDLFDPVTESWVVLQTIPGPTHTAKDQPWIEETVRVNTTYSSRVRFRAVSRGNPLGHMALDDIEVYPPDSCDAKLKSVVTRGLVPGDGCNLRTNEDVTILVQNFGLVEIDTLPICYELYSYQNNVYVSDTIVCDTAYNVGILPSANFVYQLPQTFDFSGYDTTFHLKIWLQVSCDAKLSNDTYDLKITNETQRFEYLETFEQDLNNTGGYFNSLFIAYPPDESFYSWRPNTGTTPTFSTGPNGDHTPTGPGKYMYVEADNQPPNEANLTSPCVDLTGTQAANLEYWYHMYGSDLDNDLINDIRDTLFIDVHDGSQWHLGVFKKWDQQQFSSSAPWKRQRVTISEFTGDFVKVRFRLFRNTPGARGDVAIDDVAIILPDSQELAVDHVVYPYSGRCNYHVNETIMVHVRNVGRDDLYSFPLGYEVRDNANNLLTSGSQTFTYPPGFGLAPGAIDTVAFSSPIDMSAYGTYKIKVFNLLAGDNDPEDDIAESTVIHPQAVPIPVVEDFESLPLNQNVNFSNGWRGDNIGYRWVVKRGQDVLTSTFNLTGPGNDETNGNSMSKFLLAKQLGPLPTQVGTPSKVTTPCVSIPDVPNPSIEYYYHKFGNQMGNLVLEIFDDTVWVEIARNTGETHTGHFDDWTRERVDLAPFKHQNAKFRWIAYYGTQVNGSGNSEMGLDDIWIGALPEWDISVDSIVSPNGGQFQCYSSASTIRVRFENVGVEELDFTVDSLTIRTIVKVNGVSRNSQDTIITVFNNNTINGGIPLQPDSTLLIDISPLDLSEYGAPHEITVESFMPRDTIIEDNNIFTTSFTPNISLGTLGVSPQDICLGTSSVLSTTGFQGEIEWQYWREIGNNGVWQRVIGGLNGRPQMSVVPSDTTIYRLKICNTSISDSVINSDEAPFNQVLTVNVIDPVAPEAVHDTVCGSGTLVLQAIADPIVQSVNWYAEEDDDNKFYTGFTYSDVFTETDTFYLESVINGCKSRKKTPVYAKVEPYPVINLGPDTAICPDSVYYLNAGGGANYVYRWTRTGDPSYHDSLDNQVQSIGIFPYDIWNADSSNASYITINYSVYVESPFKCASVGSVNITVLSKDTGICTVGIDDEYVNNQLQIYPNPSSGVFTVYLDRDNSSKAALELYSIDGKAIFEEEIETPEYTRRFDLSKYPNGVYFIKLVSDEATVTKKVILTN